MNFSNFCIVREETDGLALRGPIGLVLVIVKPFTTVVLFGASLAIAAWPLRQALVHRGLGHGPAAVALLLLSLALGFVALLLAISQIGGPLLILIWGGAAWWLFARGPAALGR